VQRQGLAVEPHRIPTWRQYWEPQTEIKFEQASRLMEGSISRNPSAATTQQRRRQRSVGNQLLLARDRQPQLPRPPGGRCANNANSSRPPCHQWFTAQGAGQPPQEAAVQRCNTPRSGIILGGRVPGRRVHTHQEAKFSRHGQRDYDGATPQGAGSSSVAGFLADGFTRTGLGGQVVSCQDCRKVTVIGDAQAAERDAQRLAGRQRGGWI
jgi:hypothetical protein